MSGGSQAGKPGVVPSPAAEARVGQGGDAREADEALAEGLLRDVQAALEELRGQEPVVRCIVAYSGGLDSSVLLQAAVRLRERLGLRLGALHVNHGLNSHAGLWQRYAERVATDSGVEWHAEQIEVAAGTGLEARAREKRYAVFAAHLGAGDVLLQAHHRDDQAETILFRLLRGHGIEGLCGIPARRELGAGHLLRPLLGTPRTSLRRVAAHWGLSWVEDASNTCLDHDRNYLRQVILPQLAERFPAVGERIAQSGRWMLQAQHALSLWNTVQLERCVSAGGRVLDLDALRELPADTRLLVLREWLKHRGIRPAEPQLLDLRQRLLDGPVRNGAMVVLERAVLRHYRGRLHLQADQPCTQAAGCRDQLRPAPTIASAPDGQGPAGVSARTAADLRLVPRPGRESSAPAATGRAIDAHAGQSGGVEIDWDGLDPLTLADGRVIQLPAWIPASRGPFRIAFRRGGERWMDPRSGRHRDLRKVFQERGVPPWERDSVPLLFSGAELLAVLTEDVRE